MENKKNNSGKIIIIVAVVAIMIFLFAGCSILFLLGSDPETGSDPMETTSTPASTTLSDGLNKNADVSETTESVTVDVATSAAQIKDKLQSLNSFSPNDTYDEKDYEEIPEGDGTATVLMYIVGSDLESEAAYASYNIEQILNADLSKINVVIETGGASMWYTDGIDSDYIERFVAKDGYLELVDYLPQASMTKKSTLEDFLKWGVENYPAETMCAVLWDHGGGTLYGFGADENYPDSTLSISDIANAFKATNTKFDFIGFDACLMGTLETAKCLTPCADYLIASEEVEPGEGWYYTNWLNALNRNPSGDIVKVGQIIIDDFLNGPTADYSYDLTLSMIDLSKINNVYDKLSEFMDESRANLHSDEGYKFYSNCRNKARSFGKKDYDQIDIIDYLNYFDTDASRELIDATADCVKYFGTNIYNAYGLSMYFPYEYPEEYTDVADYLPDSENDFYSDFLSMMVNGQYGEDYDDYEDTNNPVVGNYLELIAQAHSNLQNLSWYQADCVDPDSLEDFLNSDGDLMIQEKGDSFVLSLPSDSWDKITDIRMSVMLEDGDGYYDLGEDELYQFDDDGDLLVEYDYKWVTLNGQTVPYYIEESGESLTTEWFTKGYVPADIKRKSDGQVIPIEIVLYWDDETPEGKVLGYRVASDTNVYERGLRSFKNGDIIMPVCDYYTNDGEYYESYYFCDDIKVNGELVVSFEDIGDYDSWIYFTLTDIYKNKYFTESVEYN